MILTATPEATFIYNLQARGYKKRYSDSVLDWTVLSPCIFKIRIDSIEWMERLGLKEVKIMGLLDALKRERAKWDEEAARKKKEKELSKEPVKLKCPICGYEFEMKIESDAERQATHIGKGLIFLPWGIHSALKGKRCPRCKSKIG